MAKFTLRMLVALLLLTSLFFSFGIAQANAATATCSAASFGGAYAETLGISFDLNAGNCTTQDTGGGVGVSQPFSGVTLVLFNFHPGTTQAYVQANNDNSNIPNTVPNNIALSGSNLTSISNSPPTAYFYSCQTGCTISSFSATDVNGNQITFSAITITKSGTWNVSSFTVTYTPPPIPAVTSISPSSGVGNGGTPVTITGTGFVNVNSVSIGGSPVTSLNVVSSTQISAVTGPHIAAAGVSVDVSNGNGSNAPNTLFTYTAGTCSAGTSATLSMLGTTLNVNQAFNVDTLLGGPPSVPGNGGIYVTCAADTTLYPPNDVSPTTPGSISITGASGGVYTLGYDLTQIAADDAAGTYPHYVLKVTTAPPAGTDTLTTYYYSGAGVGGPYGPPTDKTFIIHLTNVVTVGPTMIANAGTTPQSATVNTAFTNALAVTVKDASNNPQSGVNVTFTAPGSGASGTFSNATATITVATNASGIASAPFSANAIPGGPYTVTAAAAGFTTVNFSMTNTPITMTANPGTTPQSATINTAFTNALAVTLKDASSNPISGINVTFTAPGSGASGIFSNSTNTITVATNASGIASAPLTANATAGGPYTVTAAAAGATTVNFSMTNTPITMTANPGTTPQSATVNTAFTNALDVTVKDASSNPVSGVNVTFTTPSSGASGTFSNSTTTITVATNASGVASAPLTANATAGGPYTVTAAATGVATVNFSMTNTPGAPSTMTANVGTTPQSATISTAFSNALGVTVKDASSNPVSGVNITFTAPGSGASGTFSNATATITVATNASGVASAPFTANATAGGPYTVTAAAAGLTTVNFSVTNVPGAPSTMTANAGTTPQSATIGTAFTNALAVTVKDAGNNLLSGVNVTFTAPGSGASGIFSNATATITIATNASGIASAPFTANATAGGPYTVTAAAAGVTTVNFSMTNTQAAQAITFGTNPGPLSFAPAGTFAVSATGGASGNAVTFASTTAAVCTVSGSTVSMVSAGTCTITANQLGNANYTAAAQVSQNITINQAAQAITFGANPGPLTYTPAGTFTVSATGGASGNAVTFASSTAAVCTVSGSTVSMVSGGTCTITANQLGNANYTAAPQVSQNITINQAAQTIVFTSTPPAVVAAGGLTYTATATGGASGNAVTFSIDGASGAGVCSIAGATVSFLASGTCIVDANQAGNGSYAPALQKQQTITVQNGVGPTVTAIGSFIADRNNAIVTNLWNMDGTIDRLNDAPGGGGPGAGLADQGQSGGGPQVSGLSSGTRLGSGQNGVLLPALAAVAPAAGSAGQDAYGLQQMVYSALRQLGETQSVNQLNYSGPFSAQMSTSGDMTGTFHTSLSQIMKWNDQAQQKEAASMGLNTSSSASAHQFNPLDVWMQGTYAAINSTQQSKFGLLSSGVDYVFNRNLLLGFYGQVDFMNQTTGLQAGGTGWMVGPYGTMRLSDQVFLEARGGYGRSSNSMTDALDPTLTDQFGSTRWLASAALAGRWQFGDHITFKPNFGFTYFTDSTDAYVNGLSVSVPSVTSQLGQFKFSPEVAKGFSLGDANWYEASIAPELIYNFTSTTADGLGSLDPTATGPQGLRGAIKWGLSMKTPSGLTVSTQGSYDGIGSSGYSAITASARLNVPLN